MSLVKPDCSPFEAFNILLDGNWHHVNELKARCGANGDRRARQLRTREYGSWTLEVKRLSNGTWYRIPINEVKSKKSDKASLLLRLKVAKVDSVDAIKVIKLPVVDIVFLIAVLQNNAHLNNLEVKKLWDQRRSIITGKLKQSLPDDVRDPYDLFEE